MSILLRRFFQNLLVTVCSGCRKQPLEKILVVSTEDFRFSRSLVVLEVVERGPGRQRAVDLLHNNFEVVKKENLDYTRLKTYKLKTIVRITTGISIVALVGVGTEVRGDAGILCGETGLVCCDVILCVETGLVWASACIDIVGCTVSFKGVGS